MALSADDFPDYATILQGGGKPLARIAIPYEGDVRMAVDAMFAEIDQQGGLPDLAALPEPVNPEDYPENEYHFLIASGLAYTLVAAKAHEDQWGVFLSNADRWAKAYLNDLDYCFFKDLVVKIT